MARPEQRRSGHRSSRFPGGRALRVGAGLALAAGLTAGFLQVASTLPAAAAGFYVVTTTADSGPGSLRQGILNYNAATSGGVDVITFSLPTPSTIDLDSTLEVDNTDGVVLSILGAGQGRTIINGQHESEVFDIESGVVNITGVTIENGSSDGGGGGIFSDATVLNLTRVSVLDSSASSGGGIFSEGTLNLYFSLVSDNTTGGISPPVKVATPADDFIGFGDGGGILNDQGTLFVGNSVIIDNTAGGVGSGVVPASGTEGGSGGGIYNFEGTVTVSSGAIIDNTAGGAITTVVPDAPPLPGGGGGGIFNYYGTVTVTDSTVSDNSAIAEVGNLVAPDLLVSGDGGGMFNCYGTLVVQVSQVDDNSAFNGGGILSDGGAGEGFTGCAFIGPAPTILRITGSGLSANTATSDGGGIYVLDTMFNLAFSAIQHNSAGLDGGGIFESGGTEAIVQSVIALNTPNNIFG
jgi:hypothetical protein